MQRRKMSIATEITRPRRIKTSRYANPVDQASTKQKMRTKPVPMYAPTECFHDRHNYAPTQYSKNKNNPISISDPYLFTLLPTQRSSEEEPTSTNTTTTITQC